MTSMDLAHIVTHSVNLKGDSVSPKKLQKLLYYVEAWNLVHLGKPLLEEDFQAWVHGPVLPSLYHELKEFGFNDLNVIAEEHETPDKEVEAIIRKNHLSDDQLSVIDSVLSKYAPLSAFELEMLSHSERPWIDARGDTPPHVSCTNLISKETMRDYYSSVLQS